MLPSRRLRALRVLADVCSDARDVEAACHATSRCEGEYNDAIRRAAFNLVIRPDVGACVVTESDDVLAEGTLVGRIREEAHAREVRFQHMLQEKYEAIEDASIQGMVRCRRCGSQEVTWDEKQTRSADEAATIFCQCSTCKNRWVMR